MVKIPRGEKGPKGQPKWPELRLKADQVDAYFDRPCNIGLILDPATNWWVDVDLDRCEAVLAAPFFFAQTLTYGHDERPRSHRIFRCVGAKPKQCQFEGGKPL
ncbi:MAG TPA: hypothetical protein VKB53_07655, partial [Gammaproteobacteria bacterium]|nr:hypothetical protein [Gammaproteobacteria bacterium]